MAIKLSFRPKTAEALQVGVAGAAVECETGSQISILMSESLEGLRVAATRQKAGTFENCEAAVVAPPGEGGIKAPAATLFAEVTVVFGNLREARLSHDAADAIAAATRTQKRRRRRRLTRVDLILCPPF